MRLIRLPQDVLSLIFQLLPLSDVLKASSLCSDILSAIREDKYLWMHILERDVKQKSRCLPTNIVPLEEAPADTIRAWVKQAILLEKSYEASSQVHSSILRIDTPARVTFARLLRGRWCIVASSSTSLSELSIWEILSPSECSLRACIYLQAPVLDGVVDNGRDYTRLAVTIGTSSPCITIYDFAMDSDDMVVIQELARIKDSSRVLLFKGLTLAFSCRDGDDTWPLIGNWMDGPMVHLKFPRGDVTVDHCPFPVEQCTGLHVWKTYALVFVYSTLHVFTLSSSDIPTRSKLLTTLTLPMFVCDVVFLDHWSSSDNVAHITTSIRWIVRTARSELMILMLSCEEDEGTQAPRFKLTEISNQERSDANTKQYGVTRDCIGASGKYIIWLSLTMGELWKPPAYNIAAIRSPETPTKVVYHWTRIHATEGDAQIIPKDGLPFSHSISCLNFDDGHGILLIGSHAGEFSLLFFAGDGFLEGNAIIGNLPSKQCKFRCMRDVSKVPMELDILPYYSIRLQPEYKNGGLPAFLIDEAERLWGNPFSDHPPIQGWSSDWSKFTRIKEWIVPNSLWSTHDSCINNDITCTRLRHRLQKYGDMIPLLYCIDNHYRVIFRLGERVLYCKTPQEGDDDDGDFEWANEDYDILGALPTTYTDFFASDSDTILAFINNVDSQRNLPMHYVEPRIELNVDSAMLISYSLQCMAKEGRSPDEKALEHWPDEVWYDVLEEGRRTNFK